MTDKWEMKYHYGDDFYTLIEKDESGKIEKHKIEIDPRVEYIWNEIEGTLWLKKNEISFYPFKEKDFLNP